MGDLVKKNTDLLPALMREVEGKIVEVRGQKALLDRDVAALYGVETREVNQAVRNNPRKFMEGYVLELTKRILAMPRREYLCWNINCPIGPVKGTRITRHCHGYWDKEYVRYTDPTGGTFYMLTGHFVNTEPEAPDTDQYANAQGYISVTPTTIDMTDKAWKDSINTGLEF